MRLFLLIIATALIQFNCSRTHPSNAESELVDVRDQQIYQVVKIGTQEWFADDLKFKTPTSYCYDNNAENCQQYGRLYNFPEAKTACPKGWRLPTEKDWKKLEKKLGMSEIQADSIRIWRGTNEGELMIKKLGIKFSGSGKSKGYKFRGKDQYVNYWVDEPGPTGEQFSMYRMLDKDNPKIYSDQVARMNLCCVRCVR